MYNLCMNKSEAGRLGAQKSKLILKQRYLKIRESYAADPKRCRKCLTMIVFERKTNDFCSRSCAAIFNNKGIVRHGTPKEPCPNCGEKIGPDSRRFCCHKCQQDFRYKVFIENWLSGKDSGNRAAKPSNHIRRYLLTTFGHACSICRLSEWTGEPIPLILDHINGNAENSSSDNLRLVCGNCNMLLPTFAGRNRGKGRKWRRDRYKKVS